MKAISATIVILAASILISVGSLAHESDTRGFLQFVGCSLGLIGLVVWYISFNDKLSK